jgi:Ca2+-binding RTX toxin-like protein
MSISKCVSNLPNCQPLVGIIDTGFSANNPHINYSQVYLGSDFIDGGDNPLLAEGTGNNHGSYILQIIDAPNVQSLWLGRAVGSGKWAESLVEFVDTVKASAHRNAVVNLSFDLAQLNPDGSVTTRYELTDRERSAIEYAQRNGILIVAAAGNENSSVSALGRASQEYDNVITVGATDGLARASYSNYGNGLTLVANGSILGIPLGTSVATAQVTKAVSQIWAVNPDLGYQQIVDVLKTTATELDETGWNPKTGFGLLNLSGGIDLAIVTTPNLHHTFSKYRIPVWQASVKDNSIALLERPASFIDDVGDFIKDVADGVVDGVATIGGVLIDAATFPFKTVGDAIAFIADKTGDGLKAGFDFVGLNVVGDATNFIFDRIGEKTQGILERAAQYIEKLPDRVKRTAGDLFSENLWENFGRWTAQNLVNILELSGIPEIAEGLADLIKFNSRALNDRERAVARSVFGDSINLDLVRIDEYSLGNLINSKDPGTRPFTTFNTINTWGTLDDGTLIHELSHVWQYGKVGAIYIPDALISQNDAGVPGMQKDYPPGIYRVNDEKPVENGYQYGGFTELEKRINNGQKLSSFNYEQQASIIEDYYRIREDKPTDYETDEAKKKGQVPENATDNDKYISLYAHFVQEVSTLPLTSLIPVSLGVTALAIGSNNADRLNGNDRDNTIFGLAGDDIIDGGLGNDRMYGGLDNDTLVVDSAGDVVKEFPDQGIDTVNSFINYTLGDNLENLTLLGNALNGTGNSLDNIITGNDADNTLSGLAGNDTLDSGGGNDTLIGGEGIDRMSGGLGNDTYFVDNSGDTIIELANQGNDIVNSSVSYILGNNLENLNLIGFNPINGTGNDLSNIITGNDANNILSGLAGSDTLNGWGGNDTLLGGEGNDSLSGGTGNDRLQGEIGNDVIDGGIDIDTVSYANSIGGVVVNIDESSNYQNLGGAPLIPTSIPISTASEPTFTIAAGTARDGFGTTDILRNLENILGSQQDDVLIGNQLANRIEGFGGNDVLIGNAGADILDGGAGNDTVSYLRDTSVSIDLSTGTAIDGFGDTDTLISIENVTGSAGDDKIVGNADANIIFAGAGNDTVSGRGGNDILFGEAGKDILQGEADNDVLVGGADADVLDGGDGNDTASYATSTAGILANLATKTGAFADAQGDRFISIENLEGSNYDDFLYGDDGNNILSGLGGNDTIRGEGGDDQIDGGSGDNVLFAGEGNNKIAAADGKNTVYAGAGNDLIVLGNGSNTVFAGDGKNTITAGSGNDTIYGGAATDVIYAGAGNNTVFAYEGQNTIFTEDGNDTIYSGAGRDFISSGGGNDTIFAGDGDNWIAAGTGNNVVYSGSGQNLFILKAGGGFDTIKNFKVGKDKLGLTDGLQPDRLTISQVNSNGFSGTQISVAGSGDVLARIEWTQASQLTANSFTLNLPSSNSSLLSLFS